MNLNNSIEIIQSVLPEPHAGLLAGIAFGVLANLPFEFKNAMIISGTLHITALSGFNISILIVIVNAVLIGLFHRKIACLITIGLIILFILYVGISPSIVRAGIMGSIALLGIILGKPVWSIYVWIVTAIVMVIIYPSWLTDISFQLSLSSSLGLILFGGSSGYDEKYQKSLQIHTKHLVNSWPFISTIRKFILIAQELAVFVFNIIKEDLRYTLAAQVFSVPLIVYHFSRLSVVSPVSNLLIGWTIPIVTVIGLFIGTFGVFCKPIALILSWPAWLFLNYMIYIINWTSRLPFAQIGG